MWKVLRLLLPATDTRVIGPIRQSSFMRDQTGEQLWRSALGVSNAGLKKGRAKRLRKRVNLNMGQQLGDGEQNISWPGLNSPVTSAGSINAMRHNEPDSNRLQRLADFRAEMTRFTKKKLAPLERGWTGNWMGGRSLGPPEPVAECFFEGFDSRILEYKRINEMTPLGRKMMFETLVATGNGCGLIGLARVKAVEGVAALQKAKKRAAQSLIYIDRFEDHTVFHNIHHKEHFTNLFIHKQHKGFGLKCPRVIRTICKLIGIKDLHVDVTNSTNSYYMATGFITALQQQETHQDMADRLGRLVVEFRKERSGFPVIVAAPTNGVVTDEPLIDPDTGEEPEFEKYFYPEGRIEFTGTNRKKHFYETYKTYQNHLSDKNRVRNRRNVEILREAGFWHAGKKVAEEKQPYDTPCSVNY